MICPLLEKLLASFDMNRKFGERRDQVISCGAPTYSMVESSPKVKPAFEISDEQISIAEYVLFYQV